MFMRDEQKPDTEIYVFYDSSKPGEKLAAAEIRRIVVQSQLGQIAHQTLS
jgi:hypothetical protein